MERVDVPEGYTCPLCPDHHDETFVHSRIVGTPICEGCSIELSYYTDDESHPNDILLDRLEELTGLSFHEYQRLAFEENIAEFRRRLLPENVDQEAELEMKITGRPFDEVVRHWRELVEYYQKRIDKLDRERN